MFCHVLEGHVLLLGFKSLMTRRTALCSKEAIRIGQVSHRIQGPSHQGIGYEAPAVDHQDLIGGLCWGRADIAPQVGK